MHAIACSYARCCCWPTSLRSVTAPKMPARSRIPPLHTTALPTEDLLNPRLAARLSFSKGLHDRLGASSPLAELSADLFDTILSYVPLDPIEVPGTKAGGAHTNNPQYYEYRDGALVLKSVCWMHVGISAAAVPRGRYAVALEMTGHKGFNLPTTVAVRLCAGGGSAPWTECCAPYTWAPNGKARGVLCMGEVLLAEESDVRVTFVQTQDGGWKSGTVWHKLSLIPLALSAPSPEQRWVLLSELDAADSAGGGSGRDRCLIS